ncbi:MAG: RsmE family RNA methyltransferase [Saprospiraceae bacterium]
MQLFYHPTIQPGISALPDEEARHALQVLRKRPGDRIDLVDGKGGWYEGIIVDANKRECTIEATLLRQENHRTPYRLIMAVSPTKSNERFEWFLEKAVEIGVDEIYPLECKRTERPKIRNDRYEKVLVSAMKQSLQAWLPQLHPMTPLKTLLAQTTAVPQRYIGWCTDDQRSELIHTCEAGKDVCICIGPEGDFTDAEVALAQQAGVVPVSLGPNRLRTETAALSATQLVAFINQIKV